MISSKQEKSKIIQKPRKKIKKEPIQKLNQKYTEAIGRRKRAIARIRFFSQKGLKEIIVNEKPYFEYFPSKEMQSILLSPMNLTGIEKDFKIIIKVKGGGLHAQSEAIRHGFARVLVKINNDYKKRLKQAGFLTRDSRERERKKFGLKRARRAPQWSKR